MPKYCVSKVPCDGSTVFRYGLGFVSYDAEYDSFSSTMTKTCLMPSAGLAGPEVGLAPAAAGIAAAAVATQARTDRSAANRRTKASGGSGGQCTGRLRWDRRRSLSDPGVFYLNVERPTGDQRLSSGRIRLAGVRATGIGSLPGDDIDAALALVFTELPDLPHLPELPARGPGADMIGRTAGVLVDLHVDLQPSGWRLVPRPGMDVRRAREMLERDLDALVPVAATHDGPLKVQLPRPGAPQGAPPGAGDPRPRPAARARPGPRRPRRRP